MFNIKKVIIAGLFAIGVLTLFALVRVFAPAWVWYLISAVGLSAAVLCAAYEPKPKVKHWLYLVSYFASDGTIQRILTLKHTLSPFSLNDKELSSLPDWVSFSCMEIDDKTAKLISNKIDQLNQQDNESED